jgi:hypothetical protein
MHVDREVNHVALVGRANHRGKGNFLHMQVEKLEREGGDTVER